VLIGINTRASTNFNGDLNGLVKSIDIQKDGSNTTLQEALTKPISIGRK
jgi:hypothetical protein